jgi:hypothetical protein
VKDAGDKAGDMFSKGTDKVGDSAKAVIDFFLRPLLVLISRTER